MPSAILDPHLLAATRGLALAARQLAAGVLPGLHASRQPGLTREFSQYRAYQPGDDTRHIDWKFYARSDRYFVRESDIESTLTVRVILDATASMRHVDSTGPGAGLRKFDAARLLATALASLAVSQGDTVRLHIVTAGKILSPPPNRRRAPLESIIRTLERVEPAGRWPSACLPERASSAETRELAVVITDAHEHGEEIRATLAPLRARRSELLLLHLLGRDEVAFPFHGPVRFEDWETGAALETDAGAARAAWLEGQRQQLRAWRRTWAHPARFDYALFRLDEPLDRALRLFLRNRRC